MSRNGRHLYERDACKNYAILKSLRSNNYCISLKKIVCVLKQCMRIVEELTSLVACKTPFYHIYIVAGTP